MANLQITEIAIYLFLLRMLYYYIIFPSCQMQPQQPSINGVSVRVFVCALSASFVCQNCFYIFSINKVFCMKRDMHLWIK